ELDDRISETKKKLAAEEAAFREAELKLAELKAKVDAEAKLKRERDARLTGLKRDAAAALAGHDLNKAEKLFQEAAGLAAEDPEVRAGVERVVAERELASLLGSAAAAVKSRNAGAFSAAVAADPARTAAMMDWLAGFDRVELVSPPGQAPEVTSVDSDGTV